MRRKRAAICAVALVLMVPFGYYIWPFRYETSPGSATGYDHLLQRNVIMSGANWKSDAELAKELQPVLLKAVREQAAEGKKLKVLVKLAMLRDAMARFHRDCGRYPTTEEGLAALWTSPDGLEGWQGPYDDKVIPIDPWGHPYIYTAPSPDGKEAYQIKSYGADGLPGGKGENADITQGPA